MYRWMGKHTEKSHGKKSQEIKSQEKSHNNKIPKENTWYLIKMKIVFFFFFFFFFGVCVHDRIRTARF